MDEETIIQNGLRDVSGELNFHRRIFINRVLLSIYRKRFKLIDIVADIWYDPKNGEFWWSIPKSCNSEISIEPPPPQDKSQKFEPPEPEAPYKDDEVW